jgi:hypothetical protein
MKVVGDTLLMKITLHSLGSGSYFLEIPNNVAIFDMNNNKIISGKTPIDATVDTPLYVEGILGTNPQDNKLYADWSATNDKNKITIKHADALMITTFTWTGSQEVPGNATYAYKVTGAPTGNGFGRRERNRDGCKYTECDDQMG